jgi:hypothetical protein
MNDEKIKEGTRIYYITGYEVKEGSVVSESFASYYVKEGSGVVILIPQKNVFESRELALEELVSLLKISILNRTKELVEKLKLPDIEKLQEILTKVNQIKSKDSN